MNAGIEKHIGASDADALAVGEAFDGIGFRLPVALHRDHLEADHHPQAIPVRIGRGEIAKDAAADLAAFGIDRNGLRHINGAIDIHLGVTGELFNALFRLNRGIKNDERYERKEEGAHSPGYFLKSTFGTSRAAASPISKNSAWVNLKKLATKLLGKDWIMVLRLRTAPL